MIDKTIAIYIFIDDNMKRAIKNPLIEMLLILRLLQML